ncbi:NADP-dependent oxidoreductase [Luteococcus peritonei]|uniref:NADP-dependent oxidoreductase n=1 Tax=Luteococcus peritonei TaxID=88874 RepID=A0ABW4RU01_9ACTN
MRIYGFDRYGDAQVQQYFELPVPTPGPEQVVIELVAAGLNPADIKVRNGQRQGKVAVSFPMAIGREAAGRVVSAPQGPGLEPGELVLGGTASGFGALSEQVVLDPAQTVPVPQGVTAEQAACIPVAIGTALDALDELAPEAGQTLLVLGAGGGVGSHLVQLARLRGVRVVGVAGTAKHEVLTGLGVEVVASGEGWVQRVRGLGPVDCLVDAVGGQTLREGAALLADPSRLRSTADVALAREVGGSGVTRRRDASLFADLAALVAGERLQVVTGATFDFDQAAEAVATVESGHTLGKVVVSR